MSEASTIHDLVHAFADGELSPEAAERFRDHLVDCAQCLAELQSIALMDDFVQAHPQALDPPAPKLLAPPSPRVEAKLLRFRPRRRHAWIAAAAAVAVAASFVVYRTTTAPIELALADSRAVEARVSWPGADRWRPYDVMRASGGRDLAPLDALARLERRGDLRGVAAGWLLSGDPERAAAYLDHAAPSPDVDSDRAAAALAAGRLEEALARADRALAARPRHPQASWNRALVLVRLGLTQTAANAFDQVAALGEPGWAAEAKTRAEALRAAEAERAATWKRASQAGKTMVASSAPPPADVVRQYPSFVRHYLYHALRAARSREQVLPLLPTAEAIDRADGETRLGDRVRATARHDLARRAPLAATYAKLVANPKALPAAEADAYLAALERSHEDDLWLGAAVLLDRLPTRLDDYQRRAHVDGDPWFLALADRAAADQASDAGDLAAAEERLLAADARCLAGHADYQCAHLEYQLARLYTRQHRTTDAHRVALAALARARIAGVNPTTLESPLYYLLGEIARFRNASSVMRAYLDEALLRFPGCKGERYVHEALAADHLIHLDTAAAQRELAAAPRCDEPITLVRADVIVSLARAAAPPPDAATVVADLHAAAARFSPGERTIADALAGRLVIDGDRARGQALLERVIADAARRPSWDADAAKARTFAQLGLVTDAARSGELDRALGRLAAATATEPPPTCALGVAVDDERTVVAARDAAGKLVGRYQPLHGHGELDAGTLIPEDVRAALRACPSVAVYAPAPVHGLPRLLPPEIAWAYRLRRDSAAPRPDAPPRRVVISNVDPPPSLQLPRLAPWSPVDGEAAAQWLHGAEATPLAALAALADATEVEVHAHGLVDLAISDASLLVLSPDVRGQFALTAGEIRAHRLAGAPIVILAACRAATIAPYLHEPWSMPTAFVEAGARAVFAPASPIPDAEAGRFFDALRARLRRGELPAAALRNERMALLQHDPTSWVRDVLVFE